MTTRSAQELVIGLVTDMHFGPEARFEGKLRKLTHRAGELLDAFVDRMNDEVHPDFVVNLGDDIEDESRLRDRERYATCMQHLSRCNAEVVHVAGNHDLVYLTPADLREAWGLGIGPLYYSFDRGPLHFVVLHTSEEKDVEITIDDEQLAWLEDDLARSDRDTVVFMHHSAADQVLSGNPWFSKVPHLCLVKQRKALRRILEQSGRVLAVFNGHLHWNHIDIHHGIPYITVQSLIENLDADAPGRAAAAHAVVRISEQAVVVEIGGEQPARYQLSRER